MPLIEWKEEFSVRAPEIDHEHRQVVGLINHLYETLSQPRAEAASVAVLGEVFARTSAHFALEEKLMLESDFDEYQDHKDDHECLLDEIREIMDDYEALTRIDADLFGQRLKKWFTEHFQTWDRRLHGRLD